MRYIINLPKSNKLAIRIRREKNTNPTALGHSAIPMCVTLWIYSAGTLSLPRFVSLFESPAATPGEQYKWPRILIKKFFPLLPCFGMCVCVCLRYLRFSTRCKKRCKRSRAQIRNSSGGMSSRAMPLLLFPSHWEVTLLYFSFYI